MKPKSFFAEFGLIWKLITPFWKSEQKLRAWGMLIAILLVNILIVYGYVELNKWSSKLYNALQENNKANFLKQVYVFIPIVIGMVTIFNVNYYLTAILGFKWRQWLTNQFTEKWLYNNNFYRVMQLPSHPDNPDQRISEDLKLFAENSLSLFISFFKEALTLASFSTILWNLSGTINLKDSIGLNIEIHGYLLWIALVYCLLGTIIAIIIGKPLVSLDFIQEKFEANFRYNLIRIREKREEIALYHGTGPEIQNLQDSFNDIKINFNNIVMRTLYLDVWRYLYINLDSMIPLLIASPMYFAGVFTLGTLMQISGAFGQVKTSLSIVVSAFTHITALLATSRRLLQLEQHLSDAKHSHKHSKIVLTHTNGTNLLCENLTLSTPTNTTLLSNLKLEVKSGEKVLIIGPSGIGKSTLVRSIAGLWAYGEGSIILPVDNIFVLPQKPYLPIATLRNVITYPNNNVSITDQQLISILSNVKLEHLADMLDKKQDWSLILSLGEQQRIAIIRLLIHKPSWVIMDEPTSSLDAKMQNTVFTLIAKYLAKSTIITVSHADDLEQFHQKVVNL